MKHIIDYRNITRYLKSKKSKNDIDPFDEEDWDEQEEQYEILCNWSNVFDRNCRMKISDASRIMRSISRKYPELLCLSYDKNNGVCRAYIIHSLDNTVVLVNAYTSVITVRNYNPVKYQNITQRLINKNNPPNFDIRFFGNHDLMMDYINKWGFEVADDLL